MDKLNTLNSLLKRIEILNYPNDFTSQSVCHSIQLIYLRIYQQRGKESIETNCTSEVEQLNTLIDKYKSLPNCIMGGNFDLMWLIGKLIRDSIINVPDFIWNMAYDIVNQYSKYLSNSPYKVDLRQRFYPIGISMIALHNPSDSVQRFVWEEQIIFKLCDCEKFLTESKYLIYHPNMLNASIIHSVMAFADLSIKQKIYPYKARQIKQFATTLTQDFLGKITQITITDTIILRIYLQQSIKDIIANLSKEDIISFLSEIGGLSVIYDNASLFERALAECEIVCPDLFGNLSDISASKILGIAMGFMNLINNNDYEV